jgi:hemolysin activation/secretion protein
MAVSSTPMFVLRHVSIAGATAISLDRLAAVYQPYLGKKVSQADLAKITEAMSEIYRSAGFHLSRAIIPPQDIQRGTVVVRVVEGSITSVRLKGKGAEQFGVEAMLGPVRTERPSRLATLERQLLLINNLPGVHIEDTALDELGSASGEFELTVSLKTWHVYSSFGIDNLGSSSVGPWQTYATAAMNSLFARGDSLALSSSTTPADPRELAFARLSYDTPIGMDGLRIGASGIYSQVQPGDYRRALGDVTTTEAAELRASIVPLQSQRQGLTLTTTLSYNNVSESDSFGSIYKDFIRTAALSADYRLKDDFGGTNYLTLSWRQGLDILGANPADDPFASRTGARPDFSALNAWFTRYQTLTDAWSVKIAGAGQMASGPLFLSQQFYLGGAAFGRGYGAAEISGDNGMAGSLELRFDQKLSIENLTGYQLYGFVDSGVAWNDGFRYTDGLALTSVGAGVRFFFPKDIQADLGLAFPLDYRAQNNPSRDVRFLFSLSSTFQLCPTRAATRCQ